MRNRLQTTNTVNTLLQAPGELISHNININLTGQSLKKVHPCRPEDPKSEQEEQFWQASFDSRLNGKGIYENVPYKYPYKYEISRGKAVPSAVEIPELEPDHPTMESPAPHPLGSHPPPRNPRRQRESDENRRPVSSVYVVDDDPMYRGRNAVYAQVHANSGPENENSHQISPPSSVDGSVDGDVSPISEHESDRFFITEARNQTTYDGQKPSGSNPYNANPTAQRSRRRPQDATGMANTSKPLPPIVPKSENKQARDISAKTKPLSMEDRPPWNGATGRQPIVKPVYDDLNVAPRTSSGNGGGHSEHKNLHFGGTMASPADKSSSSETSNDQRFGAQDPVHSPTRKNVTLSHQADTTTQQGHQTQKTHHTTTSKPKPNSENVSSSHFDPSPRSFSSPHPPLDKAINRKLPAHTSPNTIAPMHTHAQAQKVSPSPRALLTNKALPPPPQTHPPPQTRTKTQTRAPTQAQTNITTQAPTQARTKAPTQAQAKPPTAMPATTKVTETSISWLSEATDFSLDTYLEELSALGSPRTVSPAEQTISQQTSPISVMDRRRPLPGNQSPKTLSDEPFKISLRTASISHPIETPRKPERTSSAETTPEPASVQEPTQAKDRVSVLTGHIAALSSRRNQINRTIDHLTKLMPKDNLLASDEVLRKREADKQKVKALEEELADIQRQEHNLGIQLHRARKREEKNGQCESGRLWVSRYSTY